MVLVLTFICLNKKSSKVLFYIDVVLIFLAGLAQSDSEYWEIEFESKHCCISKIVLK